MCIEIGKRLRSEPSGTAARSWLTEVVGITAPAAEQLFEYLAAGLAAFGCLPTQHTIVLEQNWAATAVSTVQETQFYTRPTRHGIVKCYREFVVGRPVCRHFYRCW